jgi:N-acetylneuraminic acid mutarotase
MIHHSAASSGDGKVYMTGGQRNDGSGRILSDAYLFDGSSFTTLPSLPAGISDQVSTLLPNGTLVVLGGVQVDAVTGNPALAPLTSIHALDAGAEAWRTVTVSGEAPAARRGAVAFSDRGDRLIVMGGANVGQDEAMGDVWRLDLNNPAWITVDTVEGGESSGVWST